jgi:hypothetical protein
MKTVSTIIVLLTATIAFAQHDHSAMQHDAMNKRGDKGMGFSQEKTSHHFRILDDGGAIEVTAKNAKDAESIGEIRMHLRHIASAFAEGNFSIPMFVHDEKPAGVDTMKALRADIKYAFEELPDGGRVRIATGNPDAIHAVHDFLRYQAREHRTGDTE